MKRGTVIICTLFFPVALILYLQTLGLPVPVSSFVPGPAYVPRIYLVIAVILSAAVIIKTVLEKEMKTTVVTWDKIGSLFVGFLVMFCYIVLLNIAGYFLSTFLFIFTLSLIMGTRKLAGICVAVVFLIFTYYIFYQLFNLPLPRGMFLS
jgi:putative tricarboxylic transport membrane protein